MKCMQRALLLIFLSVNNVKISYGSIIRREIHDIRTEIIGQQQYCISCTLVDGAESIVYTMNGQEVSEQQYEESLLTAKMRELQEEQLKNHAQQRERIAFHARAERTAIIKLLSRYLEEIEQQIAHVDLLDLANYLHFQAPRTLSQDEYHTLRNISLPHVKQLLADTQSSICSLQEFVQHLATVSPRLELLVQDSIESAIAQCNDTQMLKKLLSVVA